MLEYIAMVQELEAYQELVLWSCQPSEVRKSPVEFLQYLLRNSLVLSPFLFNFVINPLLSNLKHRNLGLSVNGLFLGVFAHADNIRSSAANLKTLLNKLPS